MKYVFLWLNQDTTNLGSCIEFEMIDEYITRGGLNDVIHIDNKNINNYDLRSLIENNNYRLVILATINTLRTLNCFFTEIKKLDYYPKFNQCTLIHMGDEGFNTPCDSERNKLYTLFKNVIRFGNKDSNKYSKSIHVVPMGYISGMRRDDAPLTLASQRKYNWVWFGAIKLDRQHMINSLKLIEPCYYYNSRTWGGSMNNIGNNTKKFLRIAKFVPCSCGNAHVEGARYAEALESGAIPLIKKYRKGELKALRTGFDDYYSLLFEDSSYPLPSFYEWEHMKSFIENISDDDLDILQKKCLDWWIKNKDYFGKKMCDVIRS